MSRVTDPDVRLFISLLRAGHQPALERVEATLIKHGGNIEKTAADLGVDKKSVHRWGHELEAVGALLEKHRRGRIGRGPGKKKATKTPARSRRKFGKDAADVARGVLALGASQADAARQLKRAAKKKAAQVAKKAKT